MSKDEKAAFADLYTACGIYESILALAAKTGEWYEGPGWRDMLAGQARRIDTAYAAWREARHRTERQ
jgi:hypothetical protein